MTMRGNSDWEKVEQIARHHEMTESDHFLPVVPVPKPTVEQNLVWALTDLAKCKARLHKQEGCFAEALMWLSAGAHDRAKQVLIQGWASL